ncbi:serine hydrolase domain-containing protein [Formosa haliotis]|uniref:serine hydrolase domain-containing protein n=1 Tax=Formosa haliotis TaxID=1555194 RepID=UPI0008240123|nr:serine hydrolase domain-containing protein [Formosa haliotis]
MKTTTIKNLFFFFTFLTLFAACKEQSKTKDVEVVTKEHASKPLPDSLHTKLDSILIKYAKEHSCRVMAKVETSEDVFSYLGFDGRANAPITNFSTPYEIGSCTKLFTASAILQLVEADKFSLEDRLTDILPNKNLYEGLLVIDGKDYIDSVTVKNLLNHTTGFTDYFTTGDDEREIEIHGDPNMKFTPEDLINLSKAKPIKEPFIPGSKMSYCNVNYTLLGMIIEKYSGETFQSYIKQHIIEPLDLKHTSFGSVYIPKDMPDGHYKGKLVHMPPSLAGAAGEIISTLDDMDIFINAWYNGKLFKNPETIKLVKTQYFNEMAMGIRYGLGVIDLLDLSLGHAGQTFGFQSYVAEVPNGSSFVLSIDDGAVSAWEPALMISSELNTPEAN